MKMIYYRIRFKVTHLRNLLVRVFTKDKYYVCEECHHIHKRDGKEIRFDGDSHNMSNDIWYASVSRECFDKQQKRLRRIIRERLCS